MPRLILAVCVLALASACSESSATAPSIVVSVAQAPAAPPPPAAGPFEPGTITFAGITSADALGSYSERGLVMSLTGAEWTGSLTYGNFAPFVLFKSAAGVSTTGTVDMNGGGQLFSFVSVDVYSSTTKIPYTITGLRGGAAVFTLSDIVPNTFGRFKTVDATDPGIQIDTLRIALTNNAAPCCPNPMGLDNIVVR
jgi:hypothetical protein